jgi:hypothetical protein
MRIKFLIQLLLSYKWEVRDARTLIHPEENVEINSSSITANKNMIHHADINVVVNYAGEILYVL